jgi:hypothetical protein
MKSRRMRWAGNVACMGEMINTYKILVTKPEGKRLLGRPRHRWVNNITVDLREIGWECVDWMHQAQDRDLWWDLVKILMNLQVSQRAGNLTS